MNPTRKPKCSAAASSGIAATGQVQAATDGLGDLPGRDSLVGDRVQGGPGRRLLDGEPEEAAGVQAVHGRPARGAVAGEAGDPLGPRDRDQGRHEAVVTVAVVGRSQPHDARTGCRARRSSTSARHWPSAGPDREPPPVRPAARRGRPARWPARPGARPRVPEAMTSGRSVPASASPKVSIARRSASAAPAKSPVKAISCLKARWITPSESAAALRRTSRSSRSPRCSGRTGRLQGVGRGIRASEPDDLMSGADQLGDGGRADPAGCSGDEDAHENSQIRWLDVSYCHQT